MVTEGRGGAAHTVQCVAQQQRNCVMVAGVDMWRLPSLTVLCLSPGYKDQMFIFPCTCMLSLSTIRRAVIYWRLM